MPAPAAPTSFTLTQPTSGSPRLTLQWSHAGTDLDRFEVLFKGPDDTIWRSHVIAPASDFGAGPYSLDVGSPPGYQWAVRALNAAGEVST